MKPKPKPQKKEHLKEPQPKGLEVFLRNLSEGNTAMKKEHAQAREEFEEEPEIKEPIQEQRSEEDN